MTSDRTQRRIERLLDEAEAALDARDWATARDKAEGVLLLDEENQDGKNFLAAAIRTLAGVSEAQTSAFEERDPQGLICADILPTPLALSCPFPLSSGHANTQPTNCRRDCHKAPTAADAPGGKQSRIFATSQIQKHCRNVNFSENNQRLNLFPEINQVSHWSKHR